MSDHVENKRNPYLEKISDPVQREKIRKRTAFVKAFGFGGAGDSITDIFGNKKTLLDGRRITISSESITIKLSYGKEEFDDFIKIADVIMHKGGAFTYLAADGKTSIYVGETIEIKEN